MALKTILDSLDGLPEAVASEYTERDGKFYLNVDGIDSHPDVIGLKTKKDELLTAQKKLKDALKLWDGIDIEDAKAAIAAAEEAKEKNLISGGDLDELKKEFEKKFEKLKLEEAKKTEKAHTEAESESKAARKYFRSAEIRRAVIAAGGSVELLEPVLNGMVKVERTDADEYVLHVPGADGTPRIKDSAGTLFSIDDLLGELKGQDTYGRAFDGSGNTGSGAQGGERKGGGTGASKTIKASEIGKGDNLEDVASGKIRVED